MSSLSPQNRRILSMLRTLPSLTPLDALRDAGVYRLAARIEELRRAGYSITCDRSEGFGRYTLQEEGQLEMRLAR